jgi:hypothetical protein
MSSEKVLVEKIKNCLRAKNVTEADEKVEPETPDDQSQDQVCRVCWDGPEQNSLVSPCDCDGSMAKIHKRCLEEWINTTGKTLCEVCHGVFRVDQERERSWKALFHLGPVRWGLSFFALLGTYKAQSMLFQRRYILLVACLIRLSLFLLGKLFLDRFDWYERILRHLKTLWNDILEYGAVYLSLLLFFKRTLDRLVESWLPIEVRYTYH